MKKTAGITKYELQWQLIRASIKGQGTNLEGKLGEACAYFLETKKYDRWERVYNWLEGLLRGYKAAKDDISINIINEELFAYRKWKEDGTVLYKGDNDYGLNEESEAERLIIAPIRSVVVLWKDLYKTNSKWLEKGYNHKECNAFMDWLWNNSYELKSNVKYEYSMDYLVTKREDCNLKENKHKFFF